MPDASDAYHMVVLEEVLDSMNLPIEFKTMFLPLVREAACKQGQSPDDKEHCTPADKTSGKKKKSKKTKKKSKGPETKPESKRTEAERKDKIKADLALINAEKDPEKRLLLTREVTRKRRQEIYEGKDMPAGTAGSTLGEQGGGMAAEDIGDPDNPRISEEKWIEQEQKKIMDAKGDPSLKDKLCKGKNDKECDAVIKGWLKVAYKTGLNELNELKNNPKYRAKNPQPPGLPAGQIMDYHGKAMVKNELLQRKKDCEFLDGKAKKKCNAHYDKQLRRVGVPKFNEDGSPNTDELGETDTGVMYQTNDEPPQIGFKHTSNKKSLGDPHNNKSIGSKKQSMTEAADRQKERGNFDGDDIDAISEVVSTSMGVAAEIVERADAQAAKDTADVEDKGALVKGGGKMLSKLPARGATTGENYGDKVRKQSDYKEIGRELERMGIDPKTATDEQILEANLNLLKNGSPASGKASKIVTKEREEHKKKIAELQKKIDGGEELTPQEEAEMGEAKEALQNDPVPTKPVHYGTDKDGNPHYARVIEVDGKEEVRECDAKGNPVVTTDSTKLLYKLSEVIKTTRKHAEKQDPPLTEDSSKEELEKFGKFYTPPLSADEVHWMLFSDEANVIENTNDHRKSGMDRAHATVVKAAHDADQKWFENNQAEAEKMGWEKNEKDEWVRGKNAKNGPATQQYVDSYMEDMHWNRYIDGEHDGVGDMSINGQNVAPEDFRHCLSKLSGHKPAEEPKDPEEQKIWREALKKHLREQTRISAELETQEGDKREGRVSTESQQAHISFDTEEDVMKKGKPTGKKRKVSVGEESYRSKGVGVNGVMGSLGTSMQGCLQGQMDVRNK
jgi:hypothetical protein